MRIAVLVPVAAVLLTGSLPCAALDGPPDGAMAITVNPSGFKGETLDEKLARRLKESDRLFRSICRGCVRLDANVVQDDRPFWPQRTLDGSRPLR